jgi:hypothetical protein
MQISHAEQPKDIQQIFKENIIAVWQRKSQL